MQKININVLKAHPQNNDFFDDLDGEEFERLKNSIRDEKIYTDILVSPDMTIISGHQRIRAAKELGMTLVPIKIDEDLQDEKSKLKALISNNFGRRKNSPEKDRKALETYVSLRGYQNGGDRKSGDHNGHLKLTLEEIASELKISKTNLKRALRIERNLTDSMKELLDDGVISKTLASDTIASLSKEEQEQLISSLDVTKGITQREVQKYIDEIRELKSNPPKPDDYDDTKRKLNDYKQDYQDLRSQFDAKVKELQELRKQMENKEKEEPASQYAKKLQNSTLLFCSKVATFIEQVGGYIWLTDEINKIPELEREGYVKSVHAIKAWADTMEFNINNKVKEIN